MYTNFSFKILGTWAFSNLVKNSSSFIRDSFKARAKCINAVKDLGVLELLLLTTLHVYLTCLNQSHHLILSLISTLSLLLVR